MEHRRRDTVAPIHAVDEDHVQVHVQVQRRAEALDQRDGAGVAGAARQASLAQQMARDRAIHRAQHSVSTAGSGREQEAQRHRQ
jgi:hypothetical protein